MLQLTSKAGVVYQESEYDGSWWITFKTDKPNRFIGAEHNLPKEILKQLSKIRMTVDEQIARSRILR